MIINISLAIISTIYNQNKYSVLLEYQSKLFFSGVTEEFVPNN